MNRDELSGVFDDLDPAHFHFAGSSILDEPIEGRTSFPAFIGTHCTALRAQYAASGGQPNPVIFLESGERVRGFVAFDGESMLDFTERLTREAATMRATRLFFYRKTLVMALAADTEAAQAVADAPVDELGKSNQHLLHEGVIWYAEERFEGEVIRRSGVYDLSGEERLVDIGMVSRQPVDILKDILGPLEQ